MSTFLQSLQTGLSEALSDDERVILLGEDIVDPYGGAFKVTKGLSTRFPGRVLSTPISEAGFTGVAAGMAIRGLRPVVEVMFGDFLTLCTDQLVNHISKFSLMYDGVSVPMVIRTAMGGGRGYGATHSQSLEKMYMGIPGLQVVAASLAHDPAALIRKAIDDQNPVLFIENKQLYPQQIIDASDREVSVEMRLDDASYPVAIAKNGSFGIPDVTIIAYGGASRAILSLMRRMSREEINIKAVFPSLLSAMPTTIFRAEVDASAPILIAEEGSAGFNWGSEVASTLYEVLLPALRAPIRRLAAKASVIPCAAHLEDSVLLTEEKIEMAVLDLIA